MKLWIRIALLPLLITIVPSCKMLRETRTALAEDPQLALAVTSTLTNIIADPASSLGMLLQQGMTVANRQIELESQFRQVNERVSSGTMSRAEAAATLRAFENDARREREKMQREFISLLGGKLGKEQGAEDLNAAMSEAGFDVGNLPTTPQGWITLITTIIMLLNGKRIARRTAEIAVDVVAVPLRAVRKKAEQDVGQ